MALPPRSASVLVELSNPDGAVFGFLARPHGTILEDEIGASLIDWVPPIQKRTFAYQHYFTNYPDDVIVKVHQDLGVSSFGGIQITLQGFTDNVSVDATYPDPLSIIYEYDPTPPPGPGETPPNPNGSSKNDAFDRDASFSPVFYPRWNTDPAYELFNSDQWLTVICPPKDYEFFLDSNGTALLNKPWSIDVTVSNLDSRVLNEETELFEYYPFQQATFDFKQTVTLRIPKTWTTCCWNEGAVINGEVTFQSVDMSVEAYGAGGESWGFGGMTATTGTTANDAGSQAFSITISDSYVPVEIVIPTTPGKITFVNDFVITSVTKPS